jgi:hypothetical protein
MGLGNVTAGSPVLGPLEFLGAGASLPKATVSARLCPSPQPATTPAGASWPRARRSPAPGRPKTGSREPSRCSPDRFGLPGKGWTTSTVAVFVAWQPYAWGSRKAAGTSSGVSARAHAFAKDAASFWALRGACPACDEGCSASPGRACRAGVSAGSLAVTPGSRRVSQVPCRIRPGAWLCLERVQGGEPSLRRCTVSTVSGAAGRGLLAC